MVKGSERDGDNIGLNWVKLERWNSHSKDTDNR